MASATPENGETSAAQLIAPPQTTFTTPVKAVTSSSPASLAPTAAAEHTLPPANCSTEGGRRRVMFADLSDNLRGTWFAAGCLAIVDGPTPYKNFRGHTGVFYSFLLVDESTRMRCVCFDTIATKLAPAMLVSKSYLIENVRVEALTADPGTDQMAFQVIIDATSTVAIVTPTDLPDIPTTHSFDVPFNRCVAVCHGTKRHRVDLLGICVSAGRVVELTRRNPPKTWQRRFITLANEDAETVVVTLWGQQATTFTTELVDRPLLLTDIATTVDYGQRTLPQPILQTQRSVLGPLFSSSLLSCVIDISGTPWATTLTTFHDSWTDNYPTWTVVSGKNQLGNKPLNLKTTAIVAAAEPEAVNGVYYDVIGLNCPHCNAKCRKSSPRDYKCVACHVAVDEAKTTIWCSMELADYSGVVVVTVFGEVLASMLQMTPHEVYCEFLEKPGRHRDAIDKLLCQEFLFRINVRRDQTREEIQTIVDVAIPIDGAEGFLLMKHTEMKIANGIVAIG